MRRTCFRLSLILLFLAALTAQSQVVTGFSPAYGPPGTLVSVYGSGFSAYSSVAVYFNGVQAPASETGIVADNQIQTVVPAGATNGLIRVVLGSVNLFSSSNFVVLGSGPYITGFSPTHGSAGTLVTITGVQFTGLEAVTFNGTNATQLGAALTDSTIEIYAPANVSTGPITVTTSGGSFTTSSNFFVAPTITDFSPAAGRAGTNVFIVGQNFTGTTEVMFNGLDAASFSILSATQIEAVAPTGVSAGPITVFTAGGATQTLTNFVVLPTITGFSPVGGPYGTLVSIDGLNFGASVPTINFVGASAFVLSNSDTQVWVFVPNAAVSGPVTLANSVGTNVSTIPFYLAPSVADVFPIGGAAGTTVTINGANFLGTTAVTFNGIPAAFTVATNTQISAVVPSGVTTGLIVVTNPGGTSSDKVYFYAPPIISSFSPNNGGSGTLVRILGANLLGTTAISFGGVPGTISGTPTMGEADVVVPAAVVSGPIRLTSLGGTTSSATPFYGPPSISGAQPLAAAPGSSVTVSGMNFLGVTSVSFGSIQAGFSYVSNNQLTATIPAGFTSGVVTVNTPGGVATGPAVSALSPSLSIMRLSAGGVQISWPSLFTGWTLQTSAGLPSGGWSNSLTVPIVIGTNNVVTNSAAGTSGFYRLSQ